VFTFTRITFPAMIIVVGDTFLYGLQLLPFDRFIWFRCFWSDIHCRI